MPNTTKGFPYPSNSDPVDIPGDLQSLAEAVDTELSDYATKTGTETLTNKTITTPVSTIGFSAQSGASYTLVLGDASELVEISHSASCTVTVPPESSVNFPNGTQIVVLQTGAGQASIVAGSGVTINGTPGLKLRAQWSVATLIKRGTNLWVVAGDVVA